MSDPICYFEFHNHQRVQIRALETVGVVLERTDRGGACNEFLVAYYWEGQRRTEWMRPFELADEPKKARSVIAPPSEAAAAADESLCPAPAQQPAAAVPAEAQAGGVYNEKQIAWELERTALGDGFYPNALRFAKGLPGVTADDCALLDRFATGRSRSADRVALQVLAVRIYHSPDQQPAALAVPDGYALVPVEPTQEMLDAAGMCIVPDGKAWLDQSNRETWAAMLAAARKGEQP